VLSDKDLKDAPVMIMANKQDMQGAITAENLFSELELEQFMVTKKDIYY